MMTSILRATVKGVDNIINNNNVERIDLPSALYVSFVLQPDNLELGTPSLSAVPQVYELCKFIYIMYI